MTNPAGRNLHVAILEHNSRPVELVRNNELAEIWPSLVYDPSVDVELCVTEKRPRHLYEPGRSISIDARKLTRSPRVIEERAVFEVMIRMMMGDKDVTNPVERHARRNQLLRDAVAAIYDVRNVVDQDQS